MTAAADKPPVHRPRNTQLSLFKGEKPAQKFFHGANMNLVSPFLRNLETVKVCGHDIIYNQVLNRADQLMYLA